MTIMNPAQSCVPLSVDCNTAAEAAEHHSPWAGGWIVFKAGALVCVSLSSSALIIARVLVA